MRTVAERIRGALRSYDLAGRFGGEEFLVVSPGAAREGAAGLAERIWEVVRAGAVSDGTHEAPVTVSVGAASLEDGDEGPDDLLKRADCALYRAKEGGRDRVITL